MPLLPCWGSTRRTPCSVWGSSRTTERKKKRIFVFHFPRNSAALPHTFFKCLNPSICIHVKQLLGGSIQNKEHASYQLFSDTLAALAQTGQIRSNGCSQCLPSVPFPILLPKDTVGAISMLIKELCLVPWGNTNSD